MHLENNTQQPPQVAGRQALANTNPVVTKRTDCSHPLAGALLPERPKTDQDLINRATRSLKALKRKDLGFLLRGTCASAKDDLLNTAMLGWLAIAPTLVVSLVSTGGQYIPAMGLNFLKAEVGICFLAGASAVFCRFIEAIGRKSKFSQKADEIMKNYSANKLSGVATINSLYDLVKTIEKDSFKEKEYTTEFKRLKNEEKKIACYTELVIASLGDGEIGNIPSYQFRTLRPGTTKGYPSKVIELIERDKEHYKDDLSRLKNLRRHCDILKENPGTDAVAVADLSERIDSLTQYCPLPRDQSWSCCETECSNRFEILNDLVDKSDDISIKANGDGLAVVFSNGLKLELEISSQSIYVEGGPATISYNTEMASLNLKITGLNEFHIRERGMKSEHENKMTGVFNERDLPEKIFLLNRRILLRQESERLATAS